MGFKHLVHLLVSELHGLEDDADQIDLHRWVVCDEVRHQDVLQILRVNSVLSLEGQLFGLLLVVVHQIVMFALECVQLLDGQLQFLF